MNTAITRATGNLALIPPSAFEGPYTLLGCNGSHAEEKCTAVARKAKRNGVLPEEQRLCGGG